MLRQSSGSIRPSILRNWYARPGTEKGYAATRLLYQLRRETNVLDTPVHPAILLRDTWCNHIDQTLLYWYVVEFQTLRSCYVMPDTLRSQLLTSNHTVSVHILPACIQRPQCPDVLSWRLGPSVPIPRRLCRRRMPLRLARAKQACTGGLGAGGSKSLCGTSEAATRSASDPPRTTTHQSPASEAGGPSRSETHAEQRRQSGEIAGVHVGACCLRDTASHLLGLRGCSASARGDSARDPVQTFCE